MSKTTKPTMEQIQHFFRLMEEGLVSKSNFQLYLEGLSRPVEDKEEEKVAIATATTYRVSVDYGVTLAQMIEAGRYDWKNSDITSQHFPVECVGQVEIEAKLVCLNRAASTDEVLRHLDSLGLRPATLAELLAFGAKYPDVQREFTVVALGSVWSGPVGYRVVAYLCEFDSERGLDLAWIEDDWDDCCRFLAVSK